MSLPPVGGPVIPGFESPEALAAYRARQADEAQIAEKYKNPEQLASEMGSVNKDLYGGAFVSPEKRQTSTADEGAENDNPDLILAQLEVGDGNDESGIDIVSEEVQELVDTPFIERLIQDDVINKQTGREIQKSLLAGEYFVDIINGLENDQITSQNKQAVIHKWGMMNSEYGAKELSADFEKDFGNAFNGRKDGVFESSLKQDAYGLVASKYMIGESEDQIDKDRALDMAFGTAVNGEIEGKHFPRTEYFHKRISEVKNTDLSPDKRLQSLTEVLAYVNTDQGGKGSTIKKANARVRLQETITQAGLTEQFNKAQEALRLGQAANNKAEITQAEKEMSKIAEAANVEPGDLFTLAGGELDAGPDVPAEKPSVA